MYKNNKLFFKKLRYIILIILFITTIKEVNAAILTIEPNEIINSTTFNLTITTSVSEECRYSYTDDNFNQMPNVISTSGTIHSVQISESTDGVYTYYVGCKSQGISYSPKTITIDTIPPIITSFSPQTNITTKVFNLIVQTNENSNCSYSKTPDNYQLMNNLDSTTSSIELNWDFLNTIDYYVVCQDLALNTVYQTITINATDFPVFTSELLLDDNFLNPENEIDLFPNTTTKVWCNTTVSHINDSINSITSTLTNGITQYTNNSCFFDNTNIVCSHNLMYYDASGDWECNINATDFYLQSRQTKDNSFVTSLLAISIDTTKLDFGMLKLNEESAEKEIVIKNQGNTPVNFQIDAWPNTLDLNSPDAFSCSQGSIPIQNLKYSLISTPSKISLSEIGTITENNFNLNPAQQSSIFLSVLIPSSNIAGICNGKLGIFAIN